MQGVFGITTLTISPTDWRFPVTLVSVCIPFFILIMVLQTRAAMEAVRKCGRLVEDYFRRILPFAGTSSGMDRRQYYNSQQYSGGYGSYHGGGAGVGAGGGSGREVVGLGLGNRASGPGERGDGGTSSAGEREHGGREKWRRRLRMARRERRERRERIAAHSLSVGGGVRRAQSGFQSQHQGQGWWSSLEGVVRWDAWEWRWPWRDRADASKDCGRDLNV